MVARFLQMRLESLLQLRLLRLFDHLGKALDNLILG